MSHRRSTKTANIIWHKLQSIASFKIRHKSYNSISASIVHPFNYSTKLPFIYHLVFSFTPAMESPISPNFEALDPFLPSFLRIPGSLRDALDPAPSPRRVDTVHRARNDVAPPKLRLNVQSSPRKQTARRLASFRAQEEQHVAKMPELWIWNKFHG